MVLAGGYNVRISYIGPILYQVQYLIIPKHFSAQAQAEENIH